MEYILSFLRIIFLLTSIKYLTANMSTYYYVVTRSTSHFTEEYILLHLEKKIDYPLPSKSSVYLPFNIFQPVAPISVSCQSIGNTLNTGRLPACSYTIYYIIQTQSLIMIIQQQFSCNSFKLKFRPRENSRNKVIHRITADCCVPFI